MADHTKRHDRFIKEHIHDPYRLRVKLGDPAVCGQCGAVYHGGRWEWREHRPIDADEQECPACCRIADDCPAGFVDIDGAFAGEHLDEIKGLVRNEAQAEAAEHPLNRIMSIASHNGGMTVTTTDIHLPRRLGEALHHAYHGELSFHYEPEEYRIRVRWVR